MRILVGLDTYNHIQKSYENYFNHLKMHGQKRIFEGKEITLQTEPLNGRHITPAMYWASKVQTRFFKSTRRTGFYTPPNEQSLNTRINARAARFFASPWGDESSMSGHVQYTKTGRRPRLPQTRLTKRNQRRIKRGDLSPLYDRIRTVCLPYLYTPSTREQVQEIKARINQAIRQYGYHVLVPDNGPTDVTVTLIIEKL